MGKKEPAATYFPALAVSSAQESLTSVFGMGTGMASPPWPPARYEMPEGAARTARVARGRSPRGRGAGRKRRMREEDNMAKPHGLLVMLG